MSIPTIDDPRVTALTLVVERSTPDWFSDYDRNDMANQAARIIIGQCEAAGLLVVADNEGTVERICEALDRHQFAGIQHAAKVLDPETVNRKPWDELSERTKRLRHNQFIDTAHAAIAALRSAPPAGFPAAGGAPGDGGE